MKAKKINFFQIIRYLYPATIVFIIIVLAFLVRFLYTNVYQTIIQAELITDLRKEITDQNLKKDQFDKVIQKIESKTTATSTSIAQLKDPFQDLSANIATQSTKISP